MGKSEEFQSIRRMHTPCIKTEFGDRAMEEIGVMCKYDFEECKHDFHFYGGTGLGTCSRCGIQKTNEEIIEEGREGWEALND